MLDGDDVLDMLDGDTALDVSDVLDGDGVLDMLDCDCALDLFDRDGMLVFDMFCSDGVLDVIVGNGALDVLDGIDSDGPPTASSVPDVLGVLAEFGLDGLPVRRPTGWACLLFLGFDRCGLLAARQV